jgi:RNA polymerase sigma factor (sigma-70 family)
MSGLTRADDDQSREEGWRRDRDLVVAYQATRGRSKRERDRAFEAIVDRFGPAVLSFCAARLDSDPDAAQQAAADTFFDAYTSLYTLKEPRAAVSFLRQIAYRKVISCYKKAAQHRRERPTAEFGEHLEHDHARDSLSQPEPDVGFTAREEDLKRLLDELVRTLPPSEQRTYDLAIRRNLTAAEIGRELGIPTPTASRRLHKHRQSLLEALGITMLMRAGKGCDAFKKIDGVADFRGRIPPPALRRKAAPHYLGCDECRRQCRECVFSWTPGLVPFLFAPALQREVMERIELVAHTQTLDTGGFGQGGGRGPSFGPGRERAKWGPVVAVLLVGALLGGVLALGGAFRRAETGTLVKEPSGARPSVMSDGPGRADAPSPRAGNGRPSGAKGGGAPRREGDGGQKTTMGSTPSGKEAGGRDGGHRARQGRPGGADDGADEGEPGDEPKGPGVTGPSVKPEPPAEHPVGVLIKYGSDPLVADYGVGVTVAGAPAPRCKGITQCVYNVPHGATVEVTLPGNSKTLSWGSKVPCEPWQTTCVFTVTAPVRVPLRLQYEPG